MSRLHGWSFLVNEEGQPIDNANISLYLAGTEIPIKIHEDEFSPDSISEVPQIKTLVNGYFEFGLPDPGSSNGYDTTQKFKIQGNKAGVEYGYIDYVDIYPPLIPVDETKTDNLRNKVISNSLANLGEGHRTDSSHIIHGIEEVNELDNSSTIKHKLISDFLAYKWDDHVNKKIDDLSTISPSGSTATTSLSGEYPHNIKQLDLTIYVPDDQYDYNRVVSGNQGKNGDDHYNQNYLDYPHDILPVDRSDSDTSKNKLVSNDLIRQLYYERAYIKRYTVYTTDWYVNGDGDWEVTINHNLGEQYVSIQIGSTDSGKIIGLKDIESKDENNLVLINNLELNLKVVISS